jgi:hypothetical protein
VFAHFIFGQAGCFDVGGDRFAEFLVRYAEHGYVTDPSSSSRHASISAG